jgi:hypothetical protein
MLADKEGKDQGGHPMKMFGSKIRRKMFRGTREGELGSDIALGSECAWQKSSSGSPALVGPTAHHGGGSLKDVSADGNVQINHQQEQRQVVALSPRHLRRRYAEKGDAE